MTLANDKDFVQDGAVVDKTLEDAGRTDVHQTPRAEDQRHLPRQVSSRVTLDHDQSKREVSGHVREATHLVRK